MALLDDDRLFPADPSTRALARRLHAQVKALPIVLPHGYTDPRWYAEDLPFPDPATLFVVPDTPISPFRRGTTWPGASIAPFLPSW